PLPSKSPHTPRIINITSSTGSVGLRLDRSNPFFWMKADPYRVSKAALNMVSACQVVEYGVRWWKVLLLCLGFTVSNLGPSNMVENGAR
ncbi:hypothetical protein K458DRAFT_241959, partial [Lentithecium fluviatile CBS 122367]